MSPDVWIWPKAAVPECAPLLRAKRTSPFLQAGGSPGEYRAGLDRAPPEAG
jgi:hypothetical protein